MRTKKRFILILLVSFILLINTGIITATNIPKKSIITKEKHNIKFVEGQVIVGFKEKQSFVKSRTLVQLYGGKTVLQRLEKINAIVVQVDKGKEQEFIDRIRSDPNIKYAELNGFVDACDKTPNDPKWDEQWGPKSINCETAWEKNGIGNKDVLIAIVDSGIDYTHEDLKDNYVPLGCDWVYHDNNPMDDNGHGTHCAGIAAAVMDNNIGIAGVAQVSIMAEKVLNSFGRGSYSTIAKGITHAVDAGADIISMSLGSQTGSLTIKNACQYAWDNNVVIIASTGNEGSSVKYPAAYDTVIAVGAVDSKIRVTPWSNYGPEVELVAPGNKIISTYPNNEYKYLSGTSMATPHVAGVAALVKSMGYKSNSEIREMLRKTAIDLGPIGWDEKTGYGLVDASLRGLGAGGKKPVYIAIHKIKELDPIDPSGSDEPEWYYDIKVESNNTELTHYNFNLNTIPKILMDSTYWENEWLSNNSWDINSIHVFYVYDERYINIKITLKDRDIFFHDTADISSNPERKTLKLCYDLIDHVIIKNQSDKTYEDDGWFVADGELDGNNGDEDDAKIWFIIANTDNEQPVINNVVLQGNLVEKPITFVAEVNGGVKPYKYLWNFGDGATSSDINPTHVYKNPGLYAVTLAVIDSNNIASNVFSKLIEIISDEKPSIVQIDGDQNVKVGEDSEYNILGVDPNKLEIQYGLDWDGDEIIDEWTEYYSSGKSITVSHSWDTEGLYTFKVKARNERGVEGDFKSFSIIVPVSRNYLFSYLSERLSERFPFLTKILENIGSQAAGGI